MMWINRWYRLKQEWFGCKKGTEFRAYTPIASDGVYYKEQGRENGLVLTEVEVEKSGHFEQSPEHSQNYSYSLPENMAFVLFIILVILTDLYLWLA